MKFFAPCVALALVGCISTPPMPDAFNSHPANPHAAQSNYPLPQPALLGITNMVMVKPVTDPASEHQHGSGAKPRTEEKK